MKLYGSLSRLVSILFRKDSQDVTVRPNQATTYTAARDVQLPPGDTDHVLVSASSTATFTNKTFDADGTGNSISNIENADIKAGAAITRSKLASGTAYRIVANDASGVMSENAAITASRAVASDANGQLVASATTATELGYVSGVTSAIQTQINALTSIVDNFEWQESALDYITDNTAAPPTEVSGDRYVLSAAGGTPHADWDGADAGDIVEFNGSTWVQTNPALGMFISIDDEPNLLYYWGGAAWTTKSFESTTASTGLVKVGVDIRLDASSAGDGLGFSAGVLSVNTDDSTIEKSADTLRVKDAGITNAKVATGIDAAKLADGSVSNTEFQYISTLSSNAQDQLDGKQPLDADLTALAALASNGMIARTGAGTVAARTITAGTGISVADGDGVAGNPTISSTITQYTDEMAQDAVGGILTDSSKIDFTYDDGAPSITATIVAGSLVNADINASAAIAESKLALDQATSTLAQRDLDNLQVASLAAGSLLVGSSSSAVVNLSVGSNGQVLTVTGGTPTWETPASSPVSTYKTGWLAAAGTTKVVTHNLGTKDVMVQIYDLDNDTQIQVDSIVRTDTNTVTLTSSEAPATQWRVLVISLD